MSNDLISRIALLQKIQDDKEFLRKGLGDDAEYAYMTADSVMDKIKSMPTAYDVDKVVELLEELTNTEYEKPENCDENGFGDGEEIYEDGITQGKYEAYKKALEIAKSGGIE